MRPEQVDSMGLQAAMDYAVQKIVAQGGRCMLYASDTGVCVYGKNIGTPTEQHCGIGWLLDETNSALMEFEGLVQYMCREFPDEIPQLLVDNLGQFHMLQQLHDASASDRRRFLTMQLRKCGVDTSAPHWQAWIDMGE